MLIREKRYILSLWIMILILISIIVAFCAQNSQNINLYLIGVVIIFLSNILLGIQDIKNRFLFLVFQLTFFTFLIARPLIGIVSRTDDWMGSGQQKENIIFSFSLVFMSLLSMAVGLFLSESLYSLKMKKTKKYENKKNESELVTILRKISFFMFCITMIFYLGVQIEPVLFMRGKSYIEYYSEFQSQIPGVIHTIASFMKYSLCIFLATMPRKKYVIFPLTIFVLSAVPMLMIGVRNPIMLNGLFSVLYYFIREIKDSKDKWIGKLEKVGLVVSIPLVLIFMSMYSLIRSDKAVENLNPFKQFIHFFYQQGVTFNVLQIGYGYRKGIKALGNHYTFGGIIDYIKHGTLGQILWKTSPLPSGNCEANGIYSNSLSHNLSYISMKEDYLAGRGRGSSYLLEAYYDFGNIGVILFSICLGMILVFFLRQFGRSILISTIILVALTGIYFIPRAEATGWLTFVVTIQFWGCIGICYLGSYICIKVSWLKRILHKFQ